MKFTKKMLSLLLALVLVLGLAGCGGSGDKETEQQGGDYSGKTLTVANWQAYATDADYGAAAFEAKYGCKVEHYYINSIPELMQTLLNGGMDEIDVININPMYIKEYFANGTLQPIDVTQLENYGDLRSDLVGIDDVKDPDGNILGVPWIWGTTSLFYNADVVSEDITSWSALWDEKYAGKVGFFDDQECAIKVAAMHLGQDPYNPDMDMVKDSLVDLKSNIKTYWGTYDDFVRAYTAGDIVIGNTWGSVATELQAQGSNVKYIYPEEGTVGWCDYWCLVNGTEEKDLAMEWINFCTGSEFQNALATGGEQVYCPANSKVLEGLDDETKKLLWIYPESPDNVSLTLYMDTDTLNSWINLWTDVKAAK